MLKDWLTNGNNMLIKDGDFVIGEAEEEYIENILIAEKGNYRQFPLVGVGIKNFINAAMTPQELTKLKREIAIQLEYDGYKINSININKDFKIDIDCERV
jgi:hypothetical protein